MLTQPQDNYIGAAPGAADPAYRNWYYVSLTWLTEGGREVATAKKDLGLYFTKKQWREQSFEDKLEYVKGRLIGGGELKKGKPLGFGEHASEIVTAYRVELPTFATHPDEIVVTLRTDAYDLLVAKLDLKNRNPHRGLTPNESASLDWLRANAGRSFNVMRNEDVPIWSPWRSWNTMPCEAENAPAGFAIPRGLCLYIGRPDNAAGEQNAD